MVAAELPDEEVDELDVDASDEELAVLELVSEEDDVPPMPIDCSACMMALIKSPPGGGSVGWVVPVLVVF